MLNINCLNSFKSGNVIPFRSKINGTSANKYPNLAPLSKDCVTFTGIKPQAPLNKALMEAFDNKEICRNVYENAQVAEKDLNDFLKEIMKPYMYDENNEYGVVHEIQTRVKSPESIREKVTDKLAFAIKKDFSKGFNPEDINAIKKNCNDIIGGRIILWEPQQRKTSKLIDTLIEEVKAKHLKITKIEYYLPDEIDKNLAYFNHDDLEKLKEAVNQTYNTNIDVETNPKLTGYMALHLDVDLSNENYKSKNDGYKGEIQIVGYDVALLKDIEDLCYKLKANKEIKNGHIAYAPFSEYFIKYMESSDNPNIKEDFDTYTKEAYIRQRNLQTSNEENYSFPTIEDCGLKGKIPKELDFNNLAKIKEPCDKIYNIFENIN